MFALNVFIIINNIYNLSNSVEICMGNSVFIAETTDYGNVIVGKQQFILELAKFVKKSQVESIAN